MGKWGSEVIAGPKLVTDLKCVSCTTPPHTIRIDSQGAVWMPWLIQLHKHGICSEWSMSEMSLFHVLRGSSKSMGCSSLLVWLVANCLKGKKKKKSKSELSREYLNPFIPVLLLQAITSFPWSPSGSPVSPRSWKPSVAEGLKGWRGQVKKSWEGWGWGWGWVWDINKGQAI